MHITGSLLEGDISSLILKAREAGISYLISNGLRQVLISGPRLSQQYKEIRSAIGISHWYANEELFKKIYGRTQKQALEIIYNLLSEEDIVSLGEIGLEKPKESNDLASHDDFSISMNKNKLLPSMEDQVRILKYQFDLAKQFGMPVSCHCENAHMELVTMLENDRWKGISGLIHGFIGSEEEAIHYIDLGFYLSINHSILYPENSKGLETIKKIGLTHIVLESDAPGFPPNKQRNAPNMPFFLMDFVFELAEALHTEPEKISDITTNNACNLFHLL